MPVQLQPCGTQAAYNRHVRYHETPCDDCLDAHAEYMHRWRRGEQPEHQPPPCGTRGGHQRHRRLGETTCPACRAANTAYQHARTRRST